MPVQLFVKWPRTAQPSSLAHRLECNNRKREISACRDKQWRCKIPSKLHEMNRTSVEFCCDASSVAHWHHRRPQHSHGALRGCSPPSRRRSEAVGLSQRVNHAQACGVRFGTMEQASRRPSKPKNALQTVANQIHCVINVVIIASRQACSHGVIESDGALATSVPPW